MISLSTAEIWLIIAVLAIGTYLIRLSFLGLIGNRSMPDWVLRHLRYTPVAVLPGLVAPAVLWPAATEGVFDLSRGLAAFVTLAIGLWTKSGLWAILGGAVTLYSALAMLA